MYRVCCGAILAVALAVGACEYADKPLEMARTEQEFVVAEKIVYCLSWCKREYRRCLDSGYGEAYCKSDRELCFDSCYEE